jgi:hypothetical protein
MLIEIKQVSTKNVVKGRNKYTQMDVSYHNLDKNREEGKKSLMSFTTEQATWNALSNAKQGEVYKVKAQKNDKGFWDWVEAVKEETNQMVQGKPIPVSTRPNYETADERARRQVYIIRQSSIASAIEYYKDQGKRPKVEEVLALAKVFENYVMSENDNNEVTLKDTWEVTDEAEIK